MESRFDQWYERLLFLSLFFVLTEMAMHMPLFSLITPYKIAMLLLLGLTALRVFLEGTPFLRRFVHTVMTGLSRLRRVLVPIALYLAFDIVSLLWTNARGYAVTKYVTILSMLFLLVMTVYYVYGVLPKTDAKTKLNRLLFVIAMTAVATCVYSWGYHLFHGQTWYTRRLSMLEDYNQFSIVIIFGYFMGLLWLKRRFAHSPWLYPMMAALSALCIPVVILSGSRRSYMLMQICLLIPILPEIVSLLRQKNRGAILRFAASVGAAVVLTFAISSAYNHVTTRAYEKMVEENEDIISIIGQKAVEEILSDETALSKREVIWRMALATYKEFPLWKKALGGGGSEAADLYDRPVNAPIIEKMYWRELPPRMLDPHNFLLVELVNGGIVKLGLVLWLLLQTLVMLIRSFHRAPIFVIALFAVSIVALGNIFVSSKFGILNDKFVWTILILLLFLPTPAGSVSREA